MKQVMSDHFVAAYSVSHFCVTTVVITFTPSVCMSITLYVDGWYKHVRHKSCSLQLLWKCSCVYLISHCISLYLINPKAAGSDLRKVLQPLWQGGQPLDQGSTARFITISCSSSFTQIQHGVSEECVCIDHSLHLKWNQFATTSSDLRHWHMFK